MLSTNATFRWSFVAQALSAEMGPATRYTLLRNVMSLIKAKLFLAIELIQLEKNQTANASSVNNIFGDKKW